MSVYKGNDPCILFHGDYKPAELYGPVERPTIYWNQLMNRSKISVAAYYDYSLENDIYELTANSVGNRLQNTIQCVTGHIYFMFAIVKNGDGNTVSFVPYSFGNAVKPLYSRSNTSGEWARIYYMLRTEYSGQLLAQFMISAKGEYPQTAFYRKGSFNVFDFTAMFGEGNEPTNVQSFEMLFPEDSYPLNKGEWQVAPMGVRTAFTHPFVEELAGWREEKQTGKDIVFENTYSDTLDLILEGRHEQTQYQGYNLMPFDFSDSSVYSFINYNGRTIHRMEGNIYHVDGWQESSSIDTSFGFYTKEFIKLPPNSDVYITFAVKCSSAVSFWFGMNNNDSANQSKLIGENSNVLKLRKTVYVTLNADWERVTLHFQTDDNVKYRVQIGADSPNLYGIGSFIDIKDLVIATAPDLSYEPYVGGIPSPSPDYPQVIVPSIEQRIKVQGTKLIDPLAVTQNKALVWTSGLTFNESGSACFEEYIPVEPGDKLICNKQITQIMSYDSEKKYLGAYRGDTTWVKTSGNPLSPDQVLTVKDGIRFLRIAFRSKDAANLSDLNFRYYGMSSDYSPYRSPQYLITNYELYGSDGLYDTIEPCVKVDGEWRCRVTRRWGKWVYDGVNTVHCDTNYVYYPESRPYNYVYLSNRPFVIKQYTKHCLSNRGVFANSLSSGFSNGGVVTTTVASVFIPNQAVRNNTKEEYLAAVQEYLRQHPYEVIVERDNPIIELYDPIMLYTNPYTTIIRGNTEMVATAKVADLPDKSS